MRDTDYQLIIIGGGPAGLTAGLYASRSRLKTVLLEKSLIGGQVMLTDWVDNYPGFPEGVSGFSLIDNMASQAGRFGLETRTGSAVVSMDLDGPIKKLVLDDGAELTTQAVILANGARPRAIDVPGEKELTGKGVSYCATCDGPFYRGEHVAVVGGGNTAVQEAIYLTKFADRVTVIHRRDELRATKIVQEQARANDKIDFLFDTVVSGVKGKNAVEGLVLSNVKTGERRDFPLQGVFILIGTMPNNEELPGRQLQMKNGFVVTDREMRTNIPGVMAAGDICNKAVRQIVNAAGEGAVAVQSVEDYLNEIS